MNIQIKSTHTKIEDAIAAAGGCNREYNPSVFDKEVSKIEGDEFYVIEYLGRDTVLYKYSADIELLNAFNPYGGGLSSSLTIGIVCDGIIHNMGTFNNDKFTRRTIADMQKDNKALFVLNF